MAGALTLVANPGSASRKYALFDGDTERAGLHFEWENGRIACSLHYKNATHKTDTDLSELNGTASVVTDILRKSNALAEDDTIASIGLRIVAPGSYFLEHRRVDDEVIARLEALQPHAPIHISSTLEELRALRQQFPNVPVIGVSDSAFHITKPDYAWNYGLPLEDADRLDVKRFGYHGLSVASVIRTLEAHDKLPPKLIVCHLGSGASITAVHGGKSLDTSMGYSPLEGVIMSTRSGSIDPTAVRALKETLGFDDDAVDNYLNNHSGLLGLGGSADLRELLQREADDDHRAHLALRTYLYSVQKTVGQMAAALGGLDALVFTGTVGERSPAIRKRIIARLHYLDLFVDEHANTAAASEKLKIVSHLAHSKPIYVIPAHEAAEIARHTTHHNEL